MILAIDQGTTGTTCIAFDREGQIAGRSYSEFEQHFPRPGWVEHDAAEIWDVTHRVAAAAIAAAGIRGADLDAIGIANQRETVVAWDPATGEPIHRALVWQDRRTAERCEELRAAGHEALVRERTGLVLDPYFSATKIEWLLRNAEGAERAVFGTVDSWLLFKLTGRHATDHTNAARTMLFDIRRLAWDEELCALLGIDSARLPEPLPSAHVYGTTTAFGGEVPVAGIAGDQQAALFGQACHRAGTAKNTYGTGSFVLLHTGAEVAEPGDGLLSTVACTIDDSRRDSKSTMSSHSAPSGVSYALEASIFVTGAAVQWLRDGLGVIERAEESEALAASLEGNDGVYFVPALTGLGSPHWDPYARGTIVGLTRGSGRAHLARAALEAIAYQAVDAVRAQEASSGERLEVLKADGGAVANRWLMQFQADVLGAEVVVPEIAETTALGAAYLAGIATGRWTLEQVGEMWRQAASYEPAIGEGERGELLAGWSRALERAKGWAAPSGGATRRNHLREQGYRVATAAAVAPMPDMKPQVYKDERPAEYFDQFHASARKGVGWTYTFVRILISLPTLLIYRVRAIGVENVPRSGALVLAPNHFSQMDHFFVGLYLLRRKVRFMAKSQMFGPRVLTYVYKHGGVFPVRRGHHDEEAIETALTILEQGEMLLVYAEGGRSRSGKLGEVKPGIGRIALESGAPVVPVAIHGSEKVRRWKRFRFPKVTVQFGEPLSFGTEQAPGRERQLEVAEEIFAPVREMYAGLATRSGR